MMDKTGRSGRAALAMTRAAACLLLACLILAPALPAAAQDIRAQVQRLQQELKTLQGYVYGGQAQTGGSSSAAGGDLGRPMAARLELRISQLETQIRSLTGQIEQVDFRINQLSRKIDGLTNDVYARLDRLEQQSVLPGGGLASPADLQQQSGELAGQAPEQPAIASLSSGRAQAPAGGGQLAAGETGGQVIGSVSANSLEALRQQAAQGTLQPGAPAQAGQAPAQAQPLAPAQTQTQTAAATAQFATAKEQYDHAFGLLSQANYPAAEQALGAFLVQHPEDPLAGNAKYWLGETQYVRGQYREAAVTFAEGFQQYPNSGKAPDNLLKLAKSLAALGQGPDACGTLNELLRRYPKAPANVLQQAQRERQRLSCG